MGNGPGSHSLIEPRGIRQIQLDPSLSDGRGPTGPQSLAAGVLDGSVDWARKGRGRARKGEAGP
jgi:hypothetical protein